MIKIVNIKKYYMQNQGFYNNTGSLVKAVDDVSLEVKKAEIFGLVGESGSGKSTLGKIICCLIQADSGEVFFEGIKQSIIKNREKLNFTRRVQIVFQDPYNSLNPSMKMKDIIQEGLVLRKKSKIYCGTKLKELLEMVGLSYNSKDKFPHEFSGGQRQRIAIARALAVEPEVIILDEPVSNLDVSIQAQILNLFLELHNRLNLTYFFISHDLRVVRWFCDRVAVMEKGKIVETRGVDEIFECAHHPYTKKLISCSK